MHHGDGEVGARHNPSQLPLPQAAAAETGPPRAEMQKASQANPTAEAQWEDGAWGGGTGEDSVK